MVVNKPLARFDRRGQAAIVAAALRGKERGTAADGGQADASERDGAARGR